MTIIEHLGDYHRFHCCSDNVTIHMVKHIVGDLYPVKPSWLKKIPGLFTLNERVVLSGTWKDDLFFSYVPVGAFNVGSINLNINDDIATNQKKHDADVWYKNDKENAWTNNNSNLEDSLQAVKDEQAPFIKKYVQKFAKGEEVRYNKGDEIGYFSFGSTVVLVFEAPNFKFNVQSDQKIKFGESLGDFVSN